MSKFVLASLAACGLLFLNACSSDTKTATGDEKAAATVAAPVGPVSGKTAYWEMYTEARKWATDLMPLSLEAKEIPGIANTEDGKAAMWDATFVSASQKEMRTFTYAISAHPPDIYKGVTIGKPLPWNGAREVMPFSMSQVQVDSDGALKSASGEAAPFLKQHPEKDPTIVLKELARYQLPTWIVTWGDKKLGYVALVSGVDGKPITGK